MSDFILPVACSLLDAELQERRRDVLQKIRNEVSDVRELENGFMYCFPPGGSRIRELADMVELERQCCPFLKFSITVEPGNGPVRLEMTGPEGTKEFLAEVFN